MNRHKKRSFDSTYIVILFCLGVEYRNRIFLVVIWTRGTLLLYGDEHRNFFLVLGRFMEHFLIKGLTLVMFGKNINTGNTLLVEVRHLEERFYYMG